MCCSWFDIIDITLWLWMTLCIMDLMMTHNTEEWLQKTVFEIKINLHVWKSCKRFDLNLR